MKIAVAADQTEKLVAALGRAGIKETGGQLFGEQLAPSIFRVTELTVQSRPGTFARFVVDFAASRQGCRSFLRADGAPLYALQLYWGMAQSSELRCATQRP